MSVTSPEPGVRDAGSAADSRAHPFNAAGRRRVALPVIVGIAVLSLLFAALAASVTGFGSRPDGTAMTNSGGTVGQGTNADTSGAGASMSGNSNVAGQSGSQTSLGGGASSSGGFSTGGGNASGSGGASGGAGGASGGGR